MLLAEKIKEVLGGGDLPIVLFLPRSCVKLPTRIVEVWQKQSSGQLGRSIHLIGACDHSGISTEMLSMIAAIAKVAAGHLTEMVIHPHKLGRSPIYSDDGAGATYPSKGVTCIGGGIQLGHNLNDLCCLELEGIGFNRGDLVVVLIPNAVHKALMSAFSADKHFTALYMREACFFKC